MSSKTVPPQLFLGAQAEVTQPDIPAFAERTVGPLYEALTAAGIEPAGDLHFMCPAFRMPPEASVIHIGVPVQNSDIPAPAPWQYFTSAPFTCAWVDHNGGVATIPPGWEAFVTGLCAQGITLGPGWREIYKNWESPDSPANITEFQREIIQ